MAININANKETKTALAKKLGVSRASLYYRPIKESQDLTFKGQVEAVMSKDNSYGHRRIAYALGVSKNKALRIMKKFNLKPKRKRFKRPKKPKDINNPPVLITNKLQGLTINTINQVWAADFTYISFLGRFIYLATVIDILSRKIVGFTISNLHNANLVINALWDALNSQKEHPSIFHSDQGSEYCSNRLTELLRSKGIIQSFSKKATPTDNCYQESFYSQFKLDFGEPNQYQGVGELTEALTLAIYRYNHHRIHTALRCSPEAYATKLRLNTLLTKPIILKTRLV